MSNLSKDNQVGCERPDGLLNVHSESETCEVCTVSSNEVSYCPCGHVFDGDQHACYIVHVRLKDQIQRLTKALRIAELKASGTLANNLCPDHRDKQTGRPCLACEIDRLREALGWYADANADCSAGAGGVTLAQMAENIKHGVDPYMGAEQSPKETAARCINYPCWLPNGHTGPCSSSSEKTPGDQS